MSCWARDKATRCAQLLERALIGRRLISSSVFISSSGNDWQQQRRRMLGIVINGLLGLYHSRAAERFLARIQIPVEAREIAAGNVDANAMASFEDIAGSPQIKRV